MGKILDYIVKKGEGNYLCYKTNKVSLNILDTDVLDYDDKPASTRNKSRIAESDLTLVPTRPIFSFFLDGSRHVYKVDDMAIGKKIFPVLAGQIVVGCCEREDRDTFHPYQTYHKIVISLPDDFDVDDEGEDFCRLYCDEINEELSKLPYVGEVGIKIDKILLYKTDKKDKFNSDKDNYKNRTAACG